MSLFDIIRVPIGYLISFCYDICHNYALALLLFAIVMKVILFPLGIKQQKNTVKQAKLRPKEQAIRNHYAGKDQQKMNEEIMRLYQEEKFSPYGGCLPVVVQLIIVFALYRVIYNPLQYINHVPKENVANINYHICEMYNDQTLDAEGIPDSTLRLITNYADKIKDYNDGKTDKKPSFEIQGIDTIRIIKKNGIEKFNGEDMLGSDFTADKFQNFHLFGEFMDLSATPSFKEFNWMLLIPLITFVSTFFSMKLTKKYTYQPPQASNGNGTDAQLSMKIMDFVMPLITTVFSFQVPAVLAVYWFYQNVLGLVQQIALKKMYPYPEFTEEDYKAASREMYKGSVSKLDKKGRKNSGKIAAHRIDLLDDEPAVEENKPEKTVSEGSGMIAPAALKDESDKEK